MFLSMTVSPISAVIAVKLILSVLMGVTMGVTPGKITRVTEDGREMMAELMITGFKRFKKKGESPTHGHDCTYRARGTPLDECPCDCYEVHLFHAGWVARAQNELQHRAAKKAQR